MPRLIPTGLGSSGGGGSGGVAAPGSLVYEETFAGDALSGSWDSLGPSAPVIAGGEALLTTPSTGFTILHDTPVVDFTLAAVFTRKSPTLAGGEFGIIFKWLDANNYLLLRGTADASNWYFRLYRINNGATNWLGSSTQGTMSGETAAGINRSYLLNMWVNGNVFGWDLYRDAIPANGQVYHGFNYTIPAGAEMADKFGAGVEGRVGFSSANSAASGATGLGRFTVLEAMPRYGYPSAVAEGGLG